MSETALQLSLLTSAEMPAAVFAELEARGVYTGARLRTQRPEVYERCLALLNEGVTPLQIQQALGIEHRTVEAVAAAHAIPIQTSKRRMAERFRFAADRMLDLVHRTGDAREAKDFMIGASCATDKWQLLDGQPTSRSVDIEVTVTAQDWNAWIDSRAAISGEKGAGPGELKTLETTRLAPPSDSMADGDETQTIDITHPASPPGVLDTILATASAPEMTDRGGGGLASNPTQPTPPNASGPENFPAKGLVAPPSSDPAANATNPLDGNQCT